MTWATIISNKAMDIVFAYEKRQGRNPEEVHKKGVGHDIHSVSKSDERFIEVKGVSELWKTYTWQSLHPTEVKCLRKYPDKFFLYIVYFYILPKKRTEKNLEKAPYSIYIVPGKELLSNKFRIEIMSYSLGHISKSKLEEYKI